MFGQHDVLRPDFHNVDYSCSNPDEPPRRSSALPAARLLEWTLDHTGSLICARHADDTIFYVNAAYCAFFGTRSEVLLGTKWLPPVIRPDKSTLRRFSSPDRMTTACVRLVAGDDRQIVPLFVEYIGLLAEDGRPDGYCSIAHKSANEPRRLSSIHQNERFNDFRIAQKEQAIRSLALGVAEAQEQERRKIALDLHDDIGQMLYLLRMKIDGLREHADMPGTLDESLSILDQVITKTRTMTSDIGCHILRDFGLSKAVHAAAEAIELQHHIEFQISIDKLPDNVPNTIQVIIYRIVRELLFNIVKHAQATFATIHVQSGAEFVKVDVADNGTQENSVLDADHFGFGLKSIKEQIQLIGGIFLIKQSRILGGTHVQFIVPTTAAPAE